MNEWGYIVRLRLDMGRGWLMYDSICHFFFCPSFLFSIFSFQRKGASCNDGLDPGHFLMLYGFPIDGGGTIRSCGCVNGDVKKR